MLVADTDKCVKEESRTSSRLTEVWSPERLKCNSLITFFTACSLSNRMPQVVARQPSAYGQGYGRGRLDNRKRRLSWGDEPGGSGTKRSKPYR